ncbi:MAG: cyclic nucleotide-binding domain-containing protein [Chitinivibrionales bacterium]|nr:cyclic nucleotide-binding domain-containing protein [Chitinivibrionales bacterium]
MTTSASTPKESSGGKSALKTSEQSFTRGSLMFIEGESSCEMFIIRSGKVRILKQEGDNTVELAILGPGSVLGELSLLDHQPRSATAQVIEDVHALLIDEKDFSHTMDTVPEWLANIISIIVSRLRDTMRKTSETLVQKSIAGVIRLLLLMYDYEPEKFESQKRSLPLRGVKEVINATMGLGEIESESVLLHLTLKEMIVIRKDEIGKEYVFINDRDIAELYMNYLRAHQHSTLLLGEELTEAAVGLLQVLIDCGKKNGKTVKPGIIKVGIPQLEVELQRQGKGLRLELEALDCLTYAKIIFTEKSSVQSTLSTHRYLSCIYNENICERIIMLHVWLPKFKENITI